MLRLHELARRLDVAARRLARPSAQRVTLLAATALAATSVGPHRALDDYVLALIARGKGGPVGLARGVLDLFTFTRGDPEGNARLMDVGLMLPWWTEPHLKISFFRPLSSLTHFVDERLWPSSAALMHLHSLLWFAALLGAVLGLYRRFETSATTVGVAFFLYALDDAHAPALAWLANRNALIAATFGCLAIAAHDRWRREGRGVLALPALGAFLAGLLSGESAIGALGYLVAYAVFLEPGEPRRRAVSIAPYLGIVGLWRLFWAGGGFGAAGSGAYIDPLANPLTFLSVAPAKLLMLLHGQFSLPPSDLAFLSPPSHQPALVALSVATVACVVVVLKDVVLRDEKSRFWALGMMLSLAPLAATFPSDRMLLFVGIGAMALLARAFEALLANLSRLEGRLDGRNVLGLGFALVNGAMAPVLLPFRAAQMELFGIAHDKGERGIPSDAAVKEQTVVVIAAPTLLFANYIQAERELQGRPRPRHLYVLASASSTLEVVRTGRASISVRPEHGFLYTPLERHYRGDVAMTPGDHVSLSSMVARVRTIGVDGRPSDVEFKFTDPLKSYRFVTWKDGRFVPFSLPAGGKPVTLPEEDFGKVLASALLDGA